MDSTPCGGSSESVHVMTVRTIFFLGLVAITIARLWVVLDGDPVPANAYFYICGEKPETAYFDGPPGTALVVRAAAKLGAHWWLALGPLWAAAASLGCWRLGLRLAGGEPQAALGAIALNLLPNFNASALTVGSEMPALALTLAGVSIAWDAARRQHGGLGSWIVAASAFAAASLFAYEAAATGLAAATFVFLPRCGRTGIHRMGAVFVVLFVAAALAAPLAWNAARDWIPIAGWTPRALGELSLPSIGAGLKSFILALSPLFALAIPFAFFRCLTAAGDKAGAAYAALVAVPSLALSALCVYRGWPVGPEVLAATAVLLPFACRALLQSRPLLAAALALAAGFSALPWYSTTRGTTPYRTAASHILALDERLAPDLQSNLFFIAAGPDLASVLSYHLRESIIPPEGHPRVYALESQDRSSQFAFWPSYDDFIETGQPKNEYFTEMTAENPFIGHSAIYVGPEKPEDLPQALRAAFADVNPVREIDGLYIYLCLDYQTLPL